MYTKDRFTIRFYWALTFALVIGIFALIVEVSAGVKYDAVLGQFREDDASGSIDASSLINGPIPSDVYASISNSFFVSKSGKDSNTGQSPYDAKLTIQSALDAATVASVALSTHQSVYVYGGDYNEALTVYKGTSLYGAGRRATRISGSLTADAGYTGGMIGDLGFLANGTTGAKFTSLLTNDTAKLRLQNVGFAFNSLTNFTATPIVLSGGHVIFDNVGTRVPAPNFNGMGVASGSLLVATNGCRFEVSNYNLYLEDMVNTNTSITMFDLKNTGGIEIQGGSMHLSMSGDCYADVKGLLITGANGERNISDFHIHIEGDNDQLGDADGAHIEAGTTVFNSVQMHVSGFGDNHSYHAENTGTVVQVYNAADAADDELLAESGSVIEYCGNPAPRILQVDGLRWGDGQAYGGMPVPTEFSGHSGTGYVAFGQISEFVAGNDPVYNNVNDATDDTTISLMDENGAYMNMTLSVSGWSKVDNDGVESAGTLFPQEAVRGNIKNIANGVTGIVTITGAAIGETYVLEVLGSALAAKPCDSMRYWMDNSNTQTVNVVNNTDTLAMITNVATSTEMILYCVETTGKDPYLNAFRIAGPSASGFVRTDGESVWTGNENGGAQSSTNWAEVSADAMTIDGLDAVAVTNTPSTGDLLMYDGVNWVAIGDEVATISSSSDAYDVDGLRTLIVDSSGGSIVIGGLTNGVAGQMLNVIKTASANDATLEFNESSGAEKIITTTGADETKSSFGGWLLYRNANGFWYTIQ